MVFKITLKTLRGQTADQSNHAIAMVHKYRKRLQPWRVRHMSSPLPIVSESSSSGFDSSSLSNSVNAASIIGSDKVDDESYLRALNAVQAAEIVVQSIQIAKLKLTVQDQATEITTLKQIVRDQDTVIAAMMERLSKLESKASVSPVSSQGIS